METKIDFKLIKKGVKKYYILGNEYQKSIMYIQYFIGDLKILEHKVDFSRHFYLGYFNPLYLLNGNLYISKGKGRIIKRPVSNKIKALGLDPNKQYFVDHFSFELLESEFRRNY
jgi:hypothetical protein